MTTAINTKEDTYALASRRILRTLRFPSLRYTKQISRYPVANWGVTEAPASVGLVCLQRYIPDAFLRPECITN